MNIKFPALIHVTRETPEHGPSWLEIHTDGIASLTEPSQPVAIYKLVKVGTVQIQKSFQEKGPKS